VQGATFRVRGKSRAGGLSGYYDGFDQESAESVLICTSQICNEEVQRREREISESVSPRRSGHSRL
jgi:hypothetical protein